MGLADFSGFPMSYKSKARRLASSDSLAVVRRPNPVGDENVEAYNLRPREEKPRSRRAHAKPFKNLTNGAEAVTFVDERELKSLAGATESTETVPQRPRTPESQRMRKDSAALLKNYKSPSKYDTSSGVPTTKTPRERSLSRVSSLEVVPEEGESYRVSLFALFNAESPDFVEGQRRRNHASNSSLEVTEDRDTTHAKVARQLAESGHQISQQQVITTEDIGTGVRRRNMGCSAKNVFKHEQNLEPEFWQFIHDNRQNLLDVLAIKDISRLPEDHEHYALIDNLRHDQGVWTYCQNFIDESLEFNDENAWLKFIILALLSDFNWLHLIANQFGRDDLMVTGSRSSNNDMTYFESVVAMATTHAGRILYHAEATLAKALDASGGEDASEQNGEATRTTLVAQEILCEIQLQTISLRKVFHPNRFSLVIPEMHAFYKLMMEYTIRKDQETMSQSKESTLGECGLESDASELHYSDSLGSLNSYFSSPDRDSGDEFLLSSPVRLSTSFAKSPQTPPSSTPTIVLNMS